MAHAMLTGRARPRVSRGRAPAFFHRSVLFLSFRRGFYEAFQDVEGQVQVEFSSWRGDPSPECFAGAHARRYSFIAGRALLLAAEGL